MTPQEKLQYLIAHPDELIKKKPFTRGSDRYTQKRENDVAAVGDVQPALLPDYERSIISQARFLAELDPACHDVLFDDNIPSITAKIGDNQYVEIEFKKMPVPFQRMILNKQVQHLCTYDLQFTLDNNKPTEQEQEDFATFKKYWKRRNQGGMRTKLVRAQKSCGDGGLLFYFDRNGQIKSRLLSYADGYVICSHNDDNGDRLLECVYYRSGENEYIDAYADTVQYRFVKKPKVNEDGVVGWQIDPEMNGKAHGFKEIPLVTKRGAVAWEPVEELIEVYEILYNIFLVIQKRHGWGILYIKGTFTEKAKKLAGSVILNDSSLNKDGDARFLTPPTPQGMIDTLRLMEESIQKGSGTTFILPKDISLSGDISGVAVQIAQSLDHEEALSAVIEWQNVADKMQRLFKYGLAKELVKTGKDTEAITRFEQMDILSSFKVWQPRSENEYNTMLSTMYGAGIISQKTAIDQNTVSAPDEELRVSAEAPASVDVNEQKITNNNPEAL